MTVTLSAGTARKGISLWQNGSENPSERQCLWLTDVHVDELVQLGPVEHVQVLRVFIARTDVVDQ